jgi:hypothetical protein
MIKDSDYNLTCFLTLREIGLNIKISNKLTQGLIKNNWRSILNKNLLKIGFTEFKIKQILDSIEDKLIIKEREDYELWSASTSF